MRRDQEMKGGDSKRRGMEFTIIKMYNIQAPTAHKEGNHYLLQTYTDKKLKNKRNRNGNLAQL